MLEIKGDGAPVREFGDYIVFMDESGDHSLGSIDPEYPLFVLVFVIVEKRAYMEQIVPAIEALKFDFWGHDAVILHAHEIRKPRGDFGFLQIREEREVFMAALNRLMNAMPVAEARGNREDAELELEFRRAMNGQGLLTNARAGTPLEMRIVSKKVNSEGLQLADLIAYPIGRHVLKPDQPNRAFDIVRPKLFAIDDRGFDEWGLKVFP